MGSVWEGKGRESEWVDIFSEGYHIRDDVADLDSDSQWRRHCVRKPKNSAFSCLLFSIFLHPRLRYDITSWEVTIISFSLDCTYRDRAMDDMRQKLVAHTAQSTSLSGQSHSHLHTVLRWRYEKTVVCNWEPTANYMSAVDLSLHV